MKRIILKTGITGLAIITLLASATNDTTSTDTVKNTDPVDNKLTYFSNHRDVDKKAATLKQVEFELIGTGYDKTIKVEGKSYKLTKDDIITREDGSRYYEIKISENSKLTLENKSIVEYFEHEGKEAALLRTAYVTVWNMGIQDYDSENNLKFSNTGYFITGDKAETIPKDRSVTFEGIMEGNSIIKSSGDSYRLVGDATITADFNIGAQSLKGSFTNILAVDAVKNTPKYFGADIIITDGKITDGSFTGKLKFIDENGENFDTLSSSMSGGFYGTDANFEIGGVGQIESPNSITSFGFTGK